MFGHRFFGAAFYGQHYFGQAAGVAAPFVDSARSAAAPVEIRVVRPDGGSRAVYPAS